MRYRWLALAFVLAVVLMPRVGVAQSSATSQQTKTGKLKQNYPNPFNPDTKGAFEIVGDPACPDGGKLHRVSLKIYNILMQEVAVPVLQGGVGGVAGNTAIEKVSLPCGQYTWYWNGFYRLGRQEAASGVYIVILDVDGHKTTMKMSVKK
jgi:hypothetical protein